jgi:AcrR family transcriptional regulator
MADDRAGAATSRLTVDDWVSAGFEILAEEGITALKIDRLCSRLAVTKGSFYWHFTDIARYRATLIDAWGELRDDDRSHFGELAHISPRERLSQMMSSLLSARHWTLERAMREWARTDDAVAASVRAADQRHGGRRSARQRHIRRRNRLPAPVRPYTERPGRGRP